MHCLVRFHSLEIRHADMVLTHGVSPSACHILAVPGPIPFATGLLTFEEDTGNIVSFKDCAINRATLKPVDTPRGHRMVMQIQDRRWRWKYKHISGEYNQLRRDGTFQSDFKKSYRELLQLLLEALGEDEANYEIEMPGHAMDLWGMPGIHVNWQHARADLELAKLLDKIGCIVTLGLDDKVRILTNGKGVNYPDNGREKMPLMHCTPSTIPAKVTVQFQDTRIQAPLVLEAVGVDPDQDILPIDDLDALGAVDLSSWTNCAPDWFPELPEKDARRARRSVFKWYAAMNVWPDAPAVRIADGPSFDSSVAAERLLPLEEQLLEHPSSLLSRPSKAYVFGDLWQGDLSGLTVEDATETESFVLDCPRGIVYFDTPVMKVDTAEVPSQAEISLVCTFRIRNEDNNEYHRYRYSVDTGTNADADAGEDVVIVPDKYLWYRYDIDTEEWEDNLSDIKEQAEQMAECYLQSFANIPQGEQEWVGLVPFPVQGNIHMMRWLVAANRCLTYGYKNVESALIAPVHHERRMREIAQGLLT